MVSLGDASRFVERPMDAKINAALPIFFLRLGQRRKPAFHERAYCSVVITRHAIVFIGDEGNDTSREKKSKGKKNSAYAE